MSKKTSRISAVTIIMFFASPLAGCGESISTGGISLGGGPQIGYGYEDCANHPNNIQIEKPLEDRGYRAGYPLPAGPPDETGTLLEDNQLSDDAIERMLNSAAHIARAKERSSVELDFDRNRDAVRTGAKEMLDRYNNPVYPISEGGGIGQLHTHIIEVSDGFVACIAMGGKTEAEVDGIDS